METSLASQQRTLTSYSHARQLEVVASLGTAEAAGETTSGAHNGAGPGNTEIAEGEREQGGKGEATDPPGTDTAATAPVVPTTVDADNAALSRIALETDMVSCKTYSDDTVWVSVVATHTLLRHASMYPETQWASPYIHEKVGCFEYEHDIASYDVLSDDTFDQTFFLVLPPK